jgi:hypothetical protein
LIDDGRRLDEIDDFGNEEEFPPEVFPKPALKQLDSIWSNWFQRKPKKPQESIKNQKNTVKEEETKKE